MHDYLTKFEHTPVIVAGDFNNWNKKRNTLIHEFCETLGLTQATFEEDKHIKRFAKHPLDLILYRNLKCDYALAVDSQQISDHNPLLLKLSKINF